MHFASLLVSLGAIATAFSISVPAKRDGYLYYFPTFINRKAATISPDYLTYELRKTVHGMAPSSILRTTYNHVAFRVL